MKLTEKRLWWHDRTGWTPKNLVSNFENWTEAKMVRDCKGIKPNAFNTPKGLKMKQATKEEMMPEFGEGSEYNKKQKELARMIKKGYRRREIQVDNLPWNLAVKNKEDEKVRNFRGTRDTINEGSMYFILTQKQDSTFEAAPIDLWYNFKPEIKYRTLTIEEADEKWEQRDSKTAANNHSLMTKIRAMDEKREEKEKAEAGDDKSSKKKAKGKGKRADGETGLVVYDDGNSDADRSDDDDAFAKAKKKFAVAEKKQKKFKNMARTNDEGEAMGELGDDDEAGDEIAYGSDDSSIFDNNDVEDDAAGVGENDAKTKVKGEKNDSELELSDDGDDDLSFGDSGSSEEEEEEKKDPGDSRGNTPADLEDDGDMDDDEINNWNNNPANMNSNPNQIINPGMNPNSKNTNQTAQNSSNLTGVNSRLNEVQIGTKRGLSSPIDNVQKRLKTEDNKVNSRSNTPTDDSSVSKESLRKVLRQPLETKKIIKKLSSRYPNKSKKDINEELMDVMKELLAQNKIIKKPVDGKTLWQWQGS